MEQVTIRRFDIGEAIRTVEVEGEGHKWLFYWLLGEHATHVYMTDGRVYVRITNVVEWREAYKRALALSGDRATGVDLACERLKRTLMKTGRWNPVI